MASVKFERIDNSRVDFGAKNKPNEFGEIHFDSISYSVPLCAYKFWNNEKKEILHSVSGDFPTNKLTAVIGPSGCGKSTLMDIVSGYRCEGFTGSVFVNCEVIGDRNKYVKQNCYIMQADDLCPFLTVEEAMSFVTCVCLPSTVTQEFRDTKMLKILQDFSLLEHRKTATKDLSGGERKRLAIALELISNPPVLFLDEPTSGLDWVSAKQCIEILHKLTKEGKTVICSIHQPSMSLLQFFHHTYILCEGRCIYQGSVNNLIHYLSDLKYECPTRYSPVEYVLEICSVGEKSAYEDMVNAIENGRSQDWFDVPTCWKRISLGTTLKTKAVNDMNTGSLFYPTSFLEQSKYVMKRILQSTIRDPFFTKNCFLGHLLMGLTLGTAFYNIGNDASKADTNYKLLFYCVMFIMFSAVVSRLVTVSHSINIIRREHFNHRYSLKSYYFAVSFIDFLMLVSVISTFCIIFYYLTGQIMEIRRFARVLIIMNILGLIFQDYGMILGMLMQVTNGMFFGISTISPWVLFSGFFILYRDTPALLQTIFDISVLRKALEAIMVAIYEDRKPLPCYQTFCYYKYPNFFLQNIDMEGKSFAVNLIILLIIYLVVKISCYFTFRYKIVRER